MQCACFVEGISGCVFEVLMGTIEIPSYPQQFIMFHLRYVSVISGRK